MVPHVNTTAQKGLTLMGPTARPQVGTHQNEHAAHHDRLVRRAAEVLDDQFQDEYDDLMRRLANNYDADDTFRGIAMCGGSTSVSR